MRAVLGLILLLAIAIPCGAAPGDGAPPPPPFGGPPSAGARPLAIGPKDWEGAARKVRGKMMLVAVIPQGVAAASVEFFLDDKSVGSVPQTPFKMEFDATSVPVGDHIFKAVARDAAAKELWSAKTNASVVSPGDNGRRPDPGAPGGRDSVAPPEPKPAPSDASPTITQKDRSADKPKLKNKKQPSPEFKLPGGYKLDNDYASADYGFSIRYPGKWTFLDQTARMNPKNPGDFWIAFGEYPVEKAPIVVNIRRVALKKGTTAQSFAKYNSYVLKWEPRTALGSPAFSTTAKVVTPKSVIHRMIVIKDGYALMMNCIDFSGKPADESRGIFENMVVTIGGGADDQARPKRDKPAAP